MIKLKRPSKPSNFDTTCRKARKAVEKAVANGNKTLSFPDTWGAYKANFSKAQYGKCGYCELAVVAGQHGDVEHYRPKGRLQTLVARGRERDNLGNVRGRRMKLVSNRGYWWYAYDWKNYLLSCMNCNQKWKKDLFPVRGNHAQARGDREQPLLLSPFGRRDPADHLDFDELGAIETWKNSKYGTATIETCGLDRATLTFERQEKSRKAHQLAKELLDATVGGSDKLFQSALKDLDEAGREGHQFAGVVRAVIGHRCSLSWKELQREMKVLQLN